MVTSAAARSGTFARKVRETPVRAIHPTADVLPG
jgi:hypothetical protein